MITARNYAAQAEYGLLKYADFLKSHNRFGDAEKVILVSSNIRNSVHFSMPDNGIIFYDGVYGIQDTEIRLPFKSITLEYYADFGDVQKIDARLNEYINKGLNCQIVRKRLILALDDDDIDEIIYCCISYFNDSKFWKVSPIIGRIKKQTDVNGFFYSSTTLLNDLDISKDMFELQDRNIKESGNVILELIEALSCKNIEQSIHQAESKKNTQRIKSNKLPIYETKFLTIKTSNKKTKTGAQGGHHASPRQHLRRGHIRRLESGNIWVNSSVVGNSEKGVIKKQYQVINNEKAT